MAEEAHRTAYERCSKCGGWKPAGPEAHAPLNTAKGRVDCIGDVIAPRNNEAKDGR